jgi:hypothetical protein
VLALATEARGANASRRCVVAAPEPEPGKVGVRPIDASPSDDQKQPLDPSRFVKDVLPGVARDHVIEWPDMQVMCCLDVDYHDVKPPAREWLTAVVLTRVTPQPIAWHFSKGGGLHLFYVAAGSFTADELAACAALRFRAVDGAAGLELKKQVRGPGAESVWQNHSQDTAAALVQWLGHAEYDEDERNAWLDSHNVEIGGRYDHTHCPINPTPQYASTGDPVSVGELGVFCHRCAGEGHALGCRRPGFAPWNAILGSPSSGEMGTLVRHLSHWGHARWVLKEKYGFAEQFARLAYKAALKAYHAGRPTERLVDCAFNAVMDGVARARKTWVSVPTNYNYGRDIQPMLSKLPVALYVGDDAKVKVDQAMVCELNQSKDLSEHGYPDLNLVYGAKIATALTSSTGPTTVAVAHSELMHDKTCLPRYVPRGQRMPLDEAWAEIEKATPGVDRKLVTAILCAIACAQETQRGMHPFIFISGTTAAGKTAQCKVAAAIYGVKAPEPRYDGDDTKFRQAIQDGASKSPLLLVNELLKDGASKKKLTPRQCLDFLLTLTPDSTSWVAYKGPMPMGRLPVLVITETHCPANLRDETQIARRLRHYRLYGSHLEWSKTLADLGVASDVTVLRGVSARMARACDAILSDVSDTYFSTPSTWDQIADSLGIQTIAAGDQDFEDTTPFLREFFRLVCAAPGLTGREDKLYPGRYKKISRNEGAKGSVEEALCAVYSRFADPEWVSARRLMEKDWGKLLGVPGMPVRLDMTPTPPNVLVRFSAGPLKKPVAINEQIVDPSAWEPLT